MKALFYRYGSICEPDIIDGFCELGVTIEQIGVEIENKNFTPKETINYVSAYLLDHPADFVFSVNFYPSLSEVCNVFHIPYLCWTVDSPVLELYTTSVQNKWNRIFIFDREDFNQLSPYNPECIFHLPLAADISKKEHLFSTVSGEDRKRYASPLSFIGSMYTEKCPYDRLSGASPYLTGYLQGIMEAQLKVYGYYFVEELLTDSIVNDFKEHFPYFYTMPGDHFLSDRRTLAQLYIATKITAMERFRTLKLLSSRFSVSLYTGSDTSALPQVHNKGLARSQTEMPLIFNASDINLNMTAKSIRSGLPQRIFDILSSGGFCLTNYQSELTDYFTPGVHLDYYSSDEELTDKIRYYSEHTALRQEISRQGNELIREKHSYPVRLMEMLELAYHKKTIS